MICVYRLVVASINLHLHWLSLTQLLIGYYILILINEIYNFSYSLSTAISSTLTIGFILPSFEFVLSISCSLILAVIAFPTSLS